MVIFTEFLTHYKDLRRLNHFQRCIDFCEVIQLKKSSWKLYVPWILVAEAVGIVAGILSSEAMQNYTQTVEKPPLSPPEWLFPIVWTILYALMGIGAARVSQRQQCPYRSFGLNLYTAQLIVNFFWPLLFFNGMAYGFALLWLILLWILVAAMILVFYRCERLAAYLQIPYLLWLTFAAYLNWGVWQMNL